MVREGIVLFTVPLFSLYAKKCIVPGYVDLFLLYWTRINFHGSDVIFTQSINPLHLMKGFVDFGTLTSTVFCTFFRSLLGSDEK